MTVIDLDAYRQTKRGWCYGCGGAGCPNHQHEWEDSGDGIEDCYSNCDACEAESDRRVDAFIAEVGDDW